MNLLQVGQLREDRLVAQRDVDETVVGKSAHGSQGSRFLAAAQSAGRDKQTGVLAPVATGGPDTAGLVPERLPLGGEVAVAGGNPEQDGVILNEVGGFSDRVARLGRGVHLAKDLLVEGLGDPR